MFCENDVQTLGDESREVIFQVGRAYLERHGITATQLVFDPAQHQVLLDDGPRFQEILQRIALLQGQHTKRPVSERMKELTAFAEAAMDRVARAHAAGTAAPGSRSDADTVLQTGVLLAQLLSRVSSWGDRCLRCLELLDSRTIEMGHGMLDQTLSEILRTRPAAAEIYGADLERPQLLDLCLSLCGAGGDRMPAPTPVVARIMARGGLADLPRSMAAMRERLLELLGGSLHLYSPEPHEEWVAMLALRQRIRSVADLDADWQLATALSRRFSRFAMPDQLNPLLAREPEYARKVVVLLQLCREIEESGARFELHGILEHYLDHRDFAAKFVGPQATREDFTDLAAEISGALVTADIPEQRKARMLELFRGHLARAVRPTGSRQMQRGQAGVEDSVAVGDLRVPLRNWSPAGLQFGPCPAGIAVGDRMTITVTIRNGSLTIDFAADAEVVRVTDGLVAARYTCRDSADETRIRTFFTI